MAKRRRSRAARNVRRKHQHSSSDGVPAVGREAPAMAPPPPPQQHGPVDHKAETEVGLPPTKNRANPLPQTPAPTPRPADHPAMPAGWLVWIDEQWHGPHPAATIREFANAGRIEPDTALRREGEDTIHRAGQVKGLFPSLPEQQPGDALTKRVDNPPEEQPVGQADIPVTSPATEPVDPYDALGTERLDDLVDDA